MKKYLIISLAALVAVCACSKVEPNNANEAISFSVVNYSSATKATTTGSTAFLACNSSFGVYAYYNTVTWDNAAAGTTQVYINGDEVTHGTPSWITEPTSAQDWATSAAYYWPKTGMLTFVGWAPYAKTPTFTKDAGITWTGYTQIVAPGETNKVDLMYSDVAADKTQSATTYGHEGVPMMFHHALSKLNFNLEYDMTGLNDTQKAMFKIKVTSLTIKALGNTATYTNADWGTPSATTATQQLAAASNVLTSTSATQANYVQDYFVLPQAPVKVDVAYQINDLPAASLTAELDLKTNSITAWEKNKIYTYTIKISPISENPITFDPNVTAWEIVDTVTLPTVK